jgi:hypothetical protein
MGAPITTSRASGIPRQGPVDRRRLQRRHAPLEATAAVLAALTAVVLALLLRPDLGDVALAMLLVLAGGLLVIPPVRALLHARRRSTSTLGR